MVRGKRVLWQTQIICEHLVTKSGVRRRGRSNLDPFLTRGWGGVVSKNGAKLCHLVRQIGPNGLPFFNPAGGAGHGRVVPAAVLCELAQGCTGELEDGPRGKCSYFEAPCIPCGRGQQSRRVRTDNRLHGCEHHFQIGLCGRFLLQVSTIGRTVERCAA